MRRRNLRLHAVVVAAFIVVALAAPALARTFTASDGSSFDAAVREAGPGDVVEVTQGTYSDWVMDVPPTTSGTATAPIVIRPSGEVVLEGRSRITVRGRWVVISGFAFHGTDAPSVELMGRGDRLTGATFLEAGSRESTYRPVVVVRSGADDAEIDHCRFVGSLSVSLQIQMPKLEVMPVPQHAHIHDNRFEDIKRRKRNGQEAIQLGQDGDTYRSMFALVEHNYFSNASGDDEIISNKSSGNVIQYNTFVDSDGAIVLRGGNDCTVDGNVLVRTKGGVRASGTGHRITNNIVVNPRQFGIVLTSGTRRYAAAKRIMVSHNTVVDSESAFIFAALDPEGIDLASDNVIVNNIFTVRGDGPVIKTDKRTPLSEYLRVNRLEQNIVWARPGMESVSARPETIAGNLTADPRLVADANGLPVVPGRDSPALGRGLPGYADRDAHGLVRPSVSGAIDVGAIQQTAR